MANVDINLIEHYQKIYEKDPRSKVFASLAEAYRKLEMPERAFDICRQGVALHPQFIGGLVALGRSALEIKKYDEAIQSLEKACQLSRENVLAHQLLADAYLHTKQPKLALKAYKKVLFFNPKHARALQVVKKLESLTADEFENDIFSMSALKKISTPQTIKTNPNIKKESSRELERHLSIIDALISRNEIEKADIYISQASRQFEGYSEIKKRLLILQHRQSNNIAEPPRPPDDVPTARDEFYEQSNVRYLKSLLNRINQKSRG